SFATTPYESIYLHGQLTAFRLSTMERNWSKLPYFENPIRLQELGFASMAYEKYWGNFFLKNDTLAPYFNCLMVTTGRSWDPDKGRRLDIVKWASMPQSEPAFTDDGIVRPTNYTFLPNSREVCPRGAYWNPIDFCSMPSVKLELPSHRSTSTTCGSTESISSGSSRNQSTSSRTYQRSGGAWFRWPNAMQVGGSWDRIALDVAEHSVVAWNVDHQVDGGD
ncbi:MAG: hypothetical protein CYPHOPRED_004870, partial [Cyphobasidiales sp. Tagirdzhanova-0007]